jgi:hypothetical protein
MSNAAVFDFGTIRRNMVGKGPSGTVYRTQEYDEPRVVDGRLVWRALNPALDAPGMKQVRLVETGHDWDTDEFFSRESACRRCGWIQSMRDAEDGVAIPPKVCPGKLEHGEACISCGMKTSVIVYDGPKYTETRCLNRKCTGGTIARKDVGLSGKDRLLARLEANVLAARAANMDYRQRVTPKTVEEWDAFIFFDNALCAEVVRAEAMLNRYNMDNNPLRKVTPAKPITEAMVIDAFTSMLGSVFETVGKVEVAPGISVDADELRFAQLSMLRD